MLALEKIIASLLVPPGFFLLVWLIITAYLIFRSRLFIIKVIAVMTLIIMVVTFTGLGVRVLLWPLENYAEYVPGSYDRPYPIVILGGGINYGIPGKEGGEPAPATLQRLMMGYRIYRQTGSPVIFSGGRGVGQSGPGEARIAGEWLRFMGVPEPEIILEEKARTTYENGVYVAEILAELDYDKIYLVTSAVHIPRAVAVFSSQGIDLIPVPAGYKYSHRLGWLEYLPGRGALDASLSAIHEWTGIIWYKIRDRI